MQMVTATLRDSDSTDYRDGCNVYTNLTAVGNVNPALGGTPVNPAPIRQFPGAGPADDLADKLSVSVTVGPVHFGRVQIAFDAVDYLGNPQAGALQETELMVNSPPRPIRGLTRGAFAAGVQSFGYTESPQLE